MPIEFRCSACSKLLRVPDESAGKQAKCPQCQAVMTIPATGASGADKTSPQPFGGGQQPAPSSGAPFDLFGSPPQAPAGGFAGSGPAGGFAGGSPAGGPTPFSPPEPKPTPGAGYTPAGGFAPTGGYTPPTGGYTPSGYSPSGYATSGGSPNVFSDAQSQGGAFNPYQSPSAPMMGGAPGYAAGGPSREAVLAKVKAPAIGMMVYAILATLVVIVNLVVTLASGQNVGFGPPPQNDAEKAGQVVGMVVGVVLALTVMTMIIIGSLKMMKLQSWGLSLTAAILASIPCNICCLVGMPFGIWGIVVLSSQDVKYWFRMGNYGGYAASAPSGMPGGMGPYGR